MVTWADTDSAIEAERARRERSVESMTMMTALLMLASAAWLAWPSIDDLMSGRSVDLTSFGAPLLLLLWGIFLQDLAVDAPSARSRLGAAASVAWPVLAVLSITGLNSTDAVGLVGSALVMSAALACRRTSTTVLRGSFGVLRFRSLMTGVGCLSGGVLVLTGERMDTAAGALGLAVLVLAVGDTVHHWFAGDEDRELRKVFRRRLNDLELRLLAMKANGDAVAQASSLLTTAKEEGHLDVKYGMRVLDECEEDMNRAVSLAGDVDAVRLASLEAVEAAEALAPIVKRPRKAYDMGVREVELGALREGEQLFRQAKRRANDVIEWWARAEQAIAAAARALDGQRGAGVAHLHELLSDARTKLNAEQPKEAFEFAVVIPPQLEADGEALDRAAASVKEARRQLNATDGLDVVELTDRLARADEALDQGHAAQAIGLADGVVRTLERERRAMDDVRRAMKQKKQLVQRFEGRSDEADWHQHLAEIESAAQAKQWSHAATLLERMTTTLDKAGQDTDEALELYDFVNDGWRILRNQCDASNIGVEDDDRRACEHAVALAGEALGVSDIEACLGHLAEADACMERLRRRV